MSKQMTITKDEVFDLLSNRRRRYALRACKRQSEPVELGDLAEQVAAWEEGKCVSEVSYDERRRVYTSLQQTHLPRLERMGVVELDRTEIELTDRAADLDVYMDVTAGTRGPWAEYYFGLSTACGVFLTAVWLGIDPFAVPDLLWATLIVGVFLLSAGVHVLRDREPGGSREELPPEVNA